MVMKKISGGNYPLRKGAGKEFFNPPDLGSTTVANRDVFLEN
jgi:hypothetical protein